MSYLEYIRQNANRIGAERQAPFTVEEVYRKRLDDLRAIDNEFFQNRLDGLLGVSLTRDYVKASFARSTYTGFVATMLWGGLGLSGWSHLVDAMTIDKQEVETKIKNLRCLLRENRIEEAFKSLQISRDNPLPQNKFAGVDISYFTKLLFFLYDGDSPVPPIIFDKWGTYIHAGILISMKEFELLNTYYKMGYDSKRRFFLQIKSNRSTQYRYSVYADYIRRMVKLSSEYMLSNPGVLEEFLFGKELRGVENCNDLNPRYFVKNYVKRYFDGSIR